MNLSSWFSGWLTLMYFKRLSSLFLFPRSWRRIWESSIFPSLEIKDLIINPMPTNAKLTIEIRLSSSMSLKLLVASSVESLSNWESTSERALYGQWICMSNTCCWLTHPGHLWPGGSPIYNHKETCWSWSCCCCWTADRESIGSLSVCIHWVFLDVLWVNPWYLWSCFWLMVEKKLKDLPEMALELSKYEPNIILPLWLTITSLGILELCYVWSRKLH